MLQEILTVGFFTAFLSAAVRLAMPLMYGGLGEMIAERAGILNIGMEGVMLSGAFFSFAGAWYFHSIPMGLLCGMLGGMAVSLLHGLLTIRLAKDPVSYTHLDVYKRQTFQSPKGRGLYVSALLRPQLPPAEVTDFTAWVAVAVCDGIEAACGLRPQIKWTNDIILNGKKVCGILTEMGLESESNALQYLIPGIGINANHAPEDFSEDVRPMATSLAQELGHPVRRSELAVQVIRALDRMYAAFPQGKQEYLDKYRAACLTPGNQVQLITPVSRREAKALAIDDEFRLVVEYPDGSREALSAGEVSVRGMYGYV